MPIFLLGGFWGFDPHKWSDIVETPKGTNGCKNTSFEQLSIRTAFRM